MAHLSLYVLGPFQAELDGAPITASKSNKVRALLAYLAVESERPHPRETLAGMLWPELPESLALAGLRDALSNLRLLLQDREAASPLISVTAGSLQLNPEGDFWVDAHAFSSLLARAPEPEALEQALALVQGEFLEGFSVRRSAPFEEWQLLKGEQIRRQTTVALYHLAGHYADRGAYARAAAHLRHLLQLAPYDDQACQRLMWVLALDGKRGEALAQYQAYHDLLDRDLGVEPATDTTAFFRRLQQGGLSDGELLRLTGSRPQAPPRSPAETLAPFTGREQELARLEEWLGLALAWEGRVALVAGEAGSGKTALLTEFARRASAAHSSLVVALGSGNEHLGHGDPYLPFREILQLLTGETEAHRSGQALGGEQARRLWGLLPVTVQALLSEGPDLVDRLLPGANLALRAEAFAPGGVAWRTRLEAVLREQSDRVRVPQTPAALHEQVTRVLFAVARRNPLLLLLDDLQWADAGSLSLLFHLGRCLAQEGSRLLVLGAYRPHDLLPSPEGAPHPLLSLVRELQRRFGEIEVDLDQAAGRPFVDALLDAEPNALGESFRTQLSNATGGHALFTVELVRDLRERGSLVRDEAGRWVQSAGPASARGQMPARVEAVIAGRLDQLPADRLALLSAASVEGELFAAEVLAGALGLDEAQVLGELNGPLSRAHLVHARGVTHLDNGRHLSHYQFRHALFQAYLYGRLNAVERARLHEAMGAVQERLHGEGSAEVAAQLARHFEAAGLAEKAADYLLLAGRRAYLLSAPREAIALYQRGLALLEAQPGPPPGTGGPPDGALAEQTRARARRELDLYLALYVSHLYVADRGAPEQAAVLARALQLAQRLGEPARLLPVLHSLGRLSLTHGEFEQARTLAWQILSLAEAAQMPAYLAVGHYLAGLSRLLSGNGRLGREEMAQALALYRRHPAAPPSSVSSGEPDTGVDILTWLSVALWILGYPDQALALNREGLELARASAHTPAPVLALSAAGTALHALSHQIQGVRECTEWMERLVREKDLAGYRPWVGFYQGWLEVHQRGAVAEGLAQMQASMSSIQAVPSYRLMLLAEAYLVAGQVDPAQQALDEALALVGQTGARLGEAEMVRLRGDLVLAAQGSQEEAEACFQQAIEVARWQQARSWELRATVSLVRLWAAQGRRETARVTLAKAYGWFTEGFGTPDLVEARALLGKLLG